MAKARKTIGDIMAEENSAYKELKSLVSGLVGDGDLSSDDVTKITDKVREYEKEDRLTSKQHEEILEIVEQGIYSKEGGKLPTILKVLAIIALVGSFISLPFSVSYLFTIGEMIASGAADTQTTVEIILIILFFVLDLIGVILTIILGVRILKQKNVTASYITTALMGTTFLMLVCDFMYEGMEVTTIVLIVKMIIYVMLSSYLNPSLRYERVLRENLHMADTEKRAKEGTLGLDLEGKGYIKLDFFNLFWIFVVGCVLGLIVEIAWHMIVVYPGVYQDRAGLMYGPFSPIYGFGCVLMTIAVNRFRNANIIVIFVVCTIIGGAFEYFVSWWMEVSFGATAWDYSDKFLNINGRTCLSFASMFGFLGLAWIKLLLPILLKLINKIPWKARYAVTTVCATLMLIDCAITVQALDCWYERLAGKPVTTEMQIYFNEHYPNDVMQNRFQSMTIDPNKSVRAD